MNIFEKLLYMQETALHVLMRQNIVLANIVFMMWYYSSNCYVYFKLHLRRSLGKYSPFSKIIPLYIRRLLIAHPFFQQWHLIRALKENNYLCFWARVSLVHPWLISNRWIVQYKSWAVLNCIQRKENSLQIDTWTC